MHQTAPRSVQSLTVPLRFLSTQSSRYLKTAYHWRRSTSHPLQSSLNTVQSRNIRFIPDLQRIRRFSPPGFKTARGKEVEPSKHPIETGSSTETPPSAYSTSPTNPGNPTAHSIQPNLYIPAAGTSSSSKRETQDPHDRHGSKRIPSHNSLSSALHRKNRPSSSSSAAYQNISTDFHPHDLTCKYHPPFAPHSPVGVCTTTTHAHPLSDPLISPPSPSPIPAPGPFTPTQPVFAEGNPRAEAEAEANRATMSDEDYAAFLEKSSADQSGGNVSAKTKSKENKSASSVKTQTASVPSALTHASFKDRTYTSDTDAPFQAVSLDYAPKSKTLKVKDVAEFADAKEGDVEDCGVEGFDPKGDYGDLVEAVGKAAGGGKVQVFRVGRSGARCEYWVLGVDEGEGRVVGWKVDAVES